MPDDVFDGRLAVIGDCDGTYMRYRGRWLGVERGPEVGVYDLRLDLEDLPEDGSRVPLITLGRDKWRTIVAIRQLDDGEVRVDVTEPARKGWDWQLGEPIELSGEVTLRVDADRPAPPSMVTDGRTVLNGALLESDDGPRPSGLRAGRPWRGDDVPRRDRGRSRRAGGLRAGARPARRLTGGAADRGGARRAPACRPQAGRRPCGTSWYSNW